MKFKIGKYQVELNVNYIKSGLIAGISLDYWNGLFEGYIDIFKYGINFCICKVKEGEV